MQNWLIAGLVVANVISSALSVVEFKRSGLANNVQGVLWHQVWGNALGFISVIAFTLLARHWSLKVAYPLTVGLTVLLVQLVAARLAFNETVTPLQAFGGVLIVSGIVLVAGPR